MQQKAPEKTSNNYLCRGPDGGTLLRVYLQPRASKNEVIGIYRCDQSEALKIRLTAPPVDNEANSKLAAFLSKLLRVAKSSVVIKKGATSRTKLLHIADITPEEAESIIKEKLHG